MLPTLLPFMYVCIYLSIYLTSYVRIYQFQKLSWKCNIYYLVLLSKIWYVNHMESRGRREQDAFPLSLGKTMCVISNKVWKSLSGLKRSTAVHKNLLQETNQLTFIVVITTLSSLPQGLPDYCWFTKSSESTQLKRCQCRRYLRIERRQSYLKIGWSSSCIHIYVFIWIYVQDNGLGAYLWRNG